MHRQSPSDRIVLADPERGKRKQHGMKSGGQDSRAECRPASPRPMAKAELLEPQTPSAEVRAPGKRLIRREARGNLPKEGSWPPSREQHALVEYPLTLGEGNPDGRSHAAVRDPDPVGRSTPQGPSTPPVPG